MYYVYCDVRSGDTWIGTDVPPDKYATGNGTWETPHTLIVGPFATHQAAIGYIRKIKNMSANLIR